MKLSDIQKLYGEASASENYEQIGEIISILNNSLPSLKKEALPLYKEIENFLFEQGRSETNLNSSRFAKSIAEWEEKSSVAFIAKQPQTTSGKPDNPVLSFEQAFVGFYNKHLNTFSSLKDFYFFKLENVDDKLEPKVLILYDDYSVNIRLLKELEAQGTQTETSGIEDFLTKFSDSTALRGSYICVLSITPSLTSTDPWKEKLNQLFDLFDTSSYITVNLRESQITASDYTEKKVDTETIEFLIGNINKVFNNQTLSYDTQRIIKSFFLENTAVIDYRILNPGASGSSVIEVQAIPVLTSTTKRYVIKIAAKKPGAESKLKAEIQNFNRYVRDFSTTEAFYSAEYKETEVMEAIKYNYASAGSLRDSMSFSELLKSNVEGKLRADIDFQVIIEKLLNCDLFKRNWNSYNSIEVKCSLLYEKYLKKNESIKAAVQKIDDENVNADLFWDCFNRIINHKLKTQKKVCHGDLHSDNFFWDGSFVNLIDFGLTEVHHAVIDHSSLEASIRLKHFPKYVSVNEILKYEERLLSTGNFESTCDLSFIKRPELRDLYNLIHQIRLDSKKHCIANDSNIEYLISLYLISYRQIQYPDLNQQLSLRFADLLGKTIVTQLL